MIWKAILLLFILFFDLFSKFWIQNNLPLISFSPPIYPYGGIGIFDSLLGIEFSLVHATNTGAAWSLFADHPSGLFFFRILLVLALIVFYTKEESPHLKFPIALILVGAIGNIIDIFLYGHVIDMFYFVFWGYSYPVFNIADSAICIGVFLYIFSSWKYANDSSNDSKTATK